MTFNLVQISADGKSFSVPPKVAKLSKMLAKAMENDDDNDDDDDNITDTDLYCPKVNGDTLEKVVKFCTHYETVEPMVEIKTPFKKGAALEDIVTQQFYCEFIQRNGRDEVFKLIRAADFLDIPPLLSLSLLAIALDIAGKTVSEIQAVFNITPPAQE